MGQENKKWWQTKTTWTGIAGLVAAVGGACTGQLPAPDAIQLGIISLLGIFGRQALLK
jgi:hypothetical protein